MAGKGSLNLKSESLLGMYNFVSGYESTIQNALFEQYKAAYKISLTNYMRGDAADAFKTYFTQGTINMIQGILDISSEMTMIIQLITEAFYQFEGASDGKIKESVLDSIEESLSGYKKTYDSMENELSSVLSLASQYISTKPLEFSIVNDGYLSVSGKIQQIREDMYAVDDEALKAADELLIRINNLKNLISQIMGLCYKDGNFIPENAADMSDKSWYSKQTNATLVLLLAENSFDYDAGAVAVSENQWAAGLCSDVYAYGGYSFLNASYESGREDGSIFMNARANVFELNGYAQFTDYLKAQGEAKALYGDIDTKAGIGEEYFGAHIEAEAGVIKVNGVVEVGTENFNGYVNGDVQVLCADGKAAFEFEEDGQFAIGVDASATLADANVGVGINFLGYDEDTGTATAQKKNNLFRLHAEGGVTAGGGFAVYAENKTAIETDYFNINATSFKFEIGLGLDILVDVTVPTLYLKWPW